MKRPVPPSIQSVRLPPPMGGINAIDSASEMPVTDCIYRYNLTPAERGLRARLGSREYVTGLTGLGDNIVRTTLPFTGSAKSGAQNKLFGTTSTGIWDCTASTTTPTQLITFANQTSEAGYGVGCVVVTSAGHFLLYCDEANGLFIYSQNDGAWTAVTMGGGGTQISGVDPANLVYCTVFKNRVWFVERDTARAWYLAAGAIYGAATSFELGTKFKAGGPLIGLYDWTVDGGSGIDDNLVALSQGGDVCIYKGTDPSSATTFGLVGVWTVGTLPAGRELATNAGGDMLLLTRAGALPLSSLLSGRIIESSQYATAKIAPLFNGLMLTRADLHGWAIRLHPTDGTLMILVPEADGQNTTQLVMSLANKSWSQYRNLPIFSACVWNGQLYYGTADGKVGLNDGYNDGITLADPTTSTPVQWALLTSFQSLGSASNKQVQTIRPIFSADGGPPAYNAQARYDFDLSELATVAAGTNSDAAWDVATWDDATWDGASTVTRAPTGTSGMGVDVAVALRGTSTSRTTLMGIDVFFTVGGLL
jgi:hypothetical protein